MIFNMKLDISEKGKTFHLELEAEKAKMLHGKKIGFESSKPSDAFICAPSTESGGCAGVPLEQVLIRIGGIHRAVEL